MRLRWISGILLLASSCWASTFDKPLATKTVDLGPSRYSSNARAQIRCYYFNGFMVKEIDLGEKGASKLAIIRHVSFVPKCRQARYLAEKDVNPAEWSGYFQGVKNNYVFFSADDGVNGGMGFAVYEAESGRKVFSDSAIGDLQFPERTDNLIAIRYARPVQAHCVIPRDPSACWKQVRKNLNLENARPPDCKAGYEKSAQTLAKGRCQAQDANTPQCIEKEIGLARKQAGNSPSVIVYPAEVILDRNPIIHPVAGELSCWPAD